MQQTDTTPAENTPQNIVAFQDLAAVDQQVQQNIADLPAAVEALATSGTSDAEIGSAIVEGIQAADPATDGLAQDAANADAGTDNSNTGNANTGNANTGNTNAGNNNNGNNNGNGKKGKNRGGNNNRRRRNTRRRV